MLDTTYMGNAQHFMQLDSLMRDTSIINHTERIEVISSSSIDGRESYNRALSRRRMEVVEATLRSRYDFIAADVWSFDYISENWSHLREVVEEDSQLPNREGVLEIIDMEDRHADAREHLLRCLDGGEPWQYLVEHILPSSRSSASVLFVPMNITPVGVAESMPAPNIEMPTMALPHCEPPTYSRPILSLRSNLLLDLCSTINIGVEVPLWPHWSISAEIVTPWWHSWGDDVTWQIESLYFDVRYWFGNRGAHNYLSGWSVGAYAGSGLYDLQPFADKGVQGEYSDFGLSLSYAHSLGRNKRWLMEYTAGLGYVTTHYRNYYVAHDTAEYGDIKVMEYPWSENTMRAVLPTRLGVTLVYLININGLKRGGRQ